MATYVHGPISGRDHARMKKKNKMDHVMEDAAEEVLNGLLCHYEPKQKHSSSKGKSILRKQRRGKQKQQQRSRRKNKNRVRWIDEEDEMLTPPGVGCSVQQACFDATAEMGCAPMMSKMNTQEAIEKTRAKQAISPRPDNNIVFDDEGNVLYLDDAGRHTKKKPIVPPKPPPPSRNEPFFPQLCGVRINCGEDDEQLMQLAKSISYRDDEEDEDKNSVVDPDTTSEASGLDDDDRPSSSAGRRTPRRRSKNLLKPLRQVIQEYQSDSDNDDEADWGDQIKSSSSSISKNSSSVFSRVFSGRKSSNNKYKTKKSTAFTSSSALPPVMSSEDDEDSSPRRRWHRPPTGEPKSPLSKLLRKSLSPKSKATTKTSSVPSEGDWDETVPIVGLKHIDLAPKQDDTQQHRRQRSSKSPRTVRRRSKSPSVNKRPYRRSSKSPSRSSRRSLSPIKSLRRSKSPGSSSSKAQQLGPRTKANSSSTTPRRESVGKAAPSPLQDSNGRHPARSPHDDDLIEQQREAASQQSDSNRLVANGRLQNKEVDRDDRMERQSYVTAHRRGFENQNENAKKPDVKEPALPVVPETATQQQREVRDDVLERQSYISKFRNENVPHRGKYQQQLYPMSEDDRLERMSYITANRDMSPRPRRSRSKSPRQQQRGRSRSPFERRQSYEGQPYFDPRLYPMEPYGGDPRAFPAVPPPPPYQQFVPYPSYPHDYGRPRYFDPTNPQAYMLQPQDPYNRQWTMPQSQTDEDDKGLLNKTSSLTEEPGDTTKLTEPEVSWEERTRQAWDRLRSGVAAMTMDTPKEEDNTISKRPPVGEAQAPLPHLPPPRVQYHLPVRPTYDYSMSPQHPPERRVTFGEPRQHIYFDELQGIPPTLHTGRKKTKMRLRGTRFIGGAIDKVKRSISSSTSRSSDYAVYGYSGSSDLGHYAEDVQSAPPVYRSHSEEERSAGRRRRRSRSPHHERRRSRSPYGHDNLRQNLAQQSPQGAWDDRAQY